MNYREAEITKYFDIAPKVRMFQLDAHEGKLDFKPGQHVNIRFEDEGEVVERPYSLLTLPGSTKFGLAVKKYEKGRASTWMHNRSIGDKVEFSEPEGKLNLKSFTEDAVFISTGSGAVPLFAMLREYISEGEGSATYIHGEKRKENLLFKDILSVLETENKDVSVEFCLSREEWSGRQGYVQEHLETILDGFADNMYYVCGLPKMVVQTKRKLVDLGADESNIVTEGWTG